MPVSIDFLSGLYNRQSCYADRLETDELDAIHVPTPVETALQTWIRSKKDIVLTGSPGDGKTFLLRRLAQEIADVKGDQVLDATAEKDYDTVVARWRKARKTGHPFFLAINHGPLNRLLQLHAAKDLVLQEVRRQLTNSVYYGDDVPKNPHGIIVLDLNLRSVLSGCIIETALDNLLREEYFRGCPYFNDETTCGAHNRQALLNAQVRERLVRLLSAAGHTTPAHKHARSSRLFILPRVWRGILC